MSDFYEVEVAAPAQQQIAFQPVRVIEARSGFRQRYWLAAVLFLLTICTTLIVGSQLENNFLRGLPLFSLDESLFPLGWIIAQPSRLLLGAPFAFSLLAILLAHELGHYVACRRYGVAASLPYFIPAPTLIGTMGAFIRIRSRIPSRNALFDIGIAGPIAGFVVAMPALLLGLWLSHPAPTAALKPDLRLGFPAIFYIANFAMHHNFRLQQLLLNPVAIAAWVGMFATALNLLPGGQLDGGHILYSIWPRAHKPASRLLLIGLLVMTPFMWVGWLLWAVVLVSFGRHPYVPATGPLGPMRKMLAISVLGMFLLVFTAVPFPGAALDLVETVTRVQSWLHLVR